MPFIPGLKSPGVSGIFAKKLTYANIFINFTENVL
jgi:hypothetical protein